MRLGYLFAVSIVLAGCAAAPTPEPTVTASAIPAATYTTSATPTATAIAEVTPSATPFTPRADFTPVSGPCPVSLAGGPAVELPEPYSDFSLSNPDGTLLTIPWPDGVVTFEPGGPGFSEPDGSLAMKWPWYRAVRGRLAISGRRLDAPAPPLRFEANDGYGDYGFQPSYLIFPADGCWEVTGAVGDASLTFVTKVVNTRK